jgi:NAD(P)-dependent dehydrogenase (short-subunit alcohol dehydrogenase family)
MPLKAARLAVPQGWIINIGDVEAMHEGPHHAAYAASKVWQE